MLSFVLYLSFIALFAGFTTAQCNTNQNPHCAGEPQFEKLCCQYPAVCYWSNRNGVPACCAAGQDCRADGGPGTTVVLPVTYVQVTTAYATSVITQPRQTVTYTPPATTQQFSTVNTIATPAVVVVGTTSAAATAATANGANGAFVTVTQAPSMAVLKYETGVLLLAKVLLTGGVCLFAANV